MSTLTCTFDEYKSARYVISQLTFLLQCDEQFWYNGQVPLLDPKELNESTNAKLDNVLGLLTKAFRGALEKLAQTNNCPQNTILSDPDSVVFKRSGGTISVCVYGKDVPELFPRRSMLLEVERIEKGINEPDRHTSLLASAANFDVSKYAKPKSFVDKVTEERSKIKAADIGGIRNPFAKEEERRDAVRASKVAAVAA